MVFGEISATKLSDCEIQKSLAVNRWRELFSLPSASAMELRSCWDWLYHSRSQDEGGRLNPTRNARSRAAARSRMAFWDALPGRPSTRNAFRANCCHKA